MVSYNVSLFTSNKHPRRTSVEWRKDRSALLSLSHISPSPSKFSLSSSRRIPLLASLIVNVSPSFARLCGCDLDLSLKIIYIYFFVCFYTGYTLLPNNTI